MSQPFVLDLNFADGTVEQKRVRINDTVLKLHGWQMVGVSDNIAQLTRVNELQLSRNAFTEIPSGVLGMTQLLTLDLSNNRLVTIPREIGRLRALTQLLLTENQLTAVPHELCQLTALAWLILNKNALTSVPAELGELRSLEWLWLNSNNLAWLPRSLDRLPPKTGIILNGNPLPIDVGHAGAFLKDSRSTLPEIYAATTALAMIREEATTLAIGLQDLSLPALVTLEIIDVAFPNSIPMHKKWDLVTAVKHFHERR